MPIRKMINIYYNINNSHIYNDNNSNKRRRITSNKQKIQ